MTRETRVGLLLGLIFIIAFGLILSELRGTGDQPAGQASEQAGGQVAPSDYYRQAEPRLKEVAFGPAGEGSDVTPGGTGATREDIARIRVVRSRPSRWDGAFSPAVIRRTDPAEDTVTPRLAERSAPHDEPQISPQPASTRSDESKGTHQVASGETLYTIAQRVYGPNRGHLYEKIYQANRDRIGDPDNIAVGQVLVIPPLSAQSGGATAARQTPVREVALGDLRQHLADRKQSSPRRVYVVVQGDNLTRIARKFFNDTSRASVDKIFQANRDKLHDRNSVVKGMKLRIPS